MMQRRQLVQGLFGGGALAAFGGCATGGGSGVPSKAKVVVIGGGFGGATAAKYVRVFSGNAIDVVMIEPNASFVSCPVSNLVIGGSRTLAELTSSYDGLRSSHGVAVVRDQATAIDASKKTVKLAGGAEIRYDKLVLSPGAELMFDEVAGLRAG
jgi:sulfide dehydrogenase [flavocytochrome c] flavoprotein chain